MKCYACAKDIGPVLALVTYNESSDRGFLFCCKCLEHIDDPKVIIHITLLNSTGTAILDERKPNVGKD